VDSDGDLDAAPKISFKDVVAKPRNPGDPICGMDGAKVAEEVTNCPWRRCGCGEFEIVLEEYWAIGRVIQEKRARQQRESDGAIREEDRHVAAR